MNRPFQTSQPVAPSRPSQGRGRDSREDHRLFDTRRRGRWLLGAVAVVTFALVAVGCEEGGDVDTPDGYDGEIVEFNPRFRMMYTSSGSDRACQGERDNYDLASLASYSDVVAVGQILSIEPATSPLVFETPGAGGDTCNGTLRVGIDVRLYLEEVYLDAAKDGVSAGRELTIRMTYGELDRYWSSTIVYDQGWLDWLSVREMFPGDRLFFSAISMPDEGLYSLAGHPFAFVNEGQVVGLSTGSYGSGCLDFTYADDLFNQPLREARDYVREALADKQPDRGGRRYVLRENTAAALLPKTALCYVRPR